jgi:hypothetical protein
MGQSKYDDRIVGPKAELTKMFDTVAANDVFAMCVDASDRDHPTAQVSPHIHAMPNGSEKVGFRRMSS